MNKSKDVSCRELSAKQQRMLSRYFDGEVSWLERMFAERLLTSNPAAGEFLESLESLRSGVNSVMAPTPKIDLWSKIEAQIENEERSAIYSKAKQAKKSNFVSGFIRFVGDRVTNLVAGARSGVGVGFGAGAVSAAVLMLAIIPAGGPMQAGNVPTTIDGFAKGTAARVLAGLESSQSDNIRRKDGVDTQSDAELVSYSPFDIQGTDFDMNAASRTSRTRLAGAGSGYRSIGQRNQNLQPVEIDWVRSDGRLRVMRDPQENNPVIFVAPRSRSIGVINGGVSRGMRGGVVSRRPTRQGLAPFDDAFDFSSASSDAAGR